MAKRKADEAEPRSSGGSAITVKKRDQLRKQLEVLVEQGEKPEGWNEAWKQGITPWDLAGEVNPAFAALVRSADPPLPPSSSRPRALVPGCGSGADVGLLASAGFEALGLDIAELAVAEARKALEGVPNAKVEVGDFFQTSELFDLGYDYTFMCALAPSMRQDWAARWAKLIRPGGELVTLIFPVVEKEGGPPFAVSPEIYTKLLTAVGFVHLGDGPRKLTDEESPPSRAGAEYICRWRRQHTPRL